MNEIYRERLEKSEFFNKSWNGEFDNFVVAEAHLVKKWTAETKSRYKSANWDYRTGTDRTVDMYKTDYEDWSGVLEDSERQKVIVQEFKWNNGVPTLEREFVLTCEKANSYYKSLLRSGYYKREIVKYA